MMATGPTHSLSGIAAIIVTAQATGHIDTFGELLALGCAGVIGAGAALIPDWDHPSATVARTFGPITRVLCEVVEGVSLGHRKLTHSLLGVAAFSALAWALVFLAGTSEGFLPLAALPLLFFVALLIGSGLRAMRVGDFRRETLLGMWNLAMSLSLAFLIYKLAPEVITLLPVVVAVGALAHLAGDMCTEGGCPLLAPLTWRDFWILPKVLRWQVSDQEGFIAEKHVVAPLLWTAVAWWGWKILAASQLFANFSLVS